MRLLVAAPRSLISRTLMVALASLVVLAGVALAPLTASAAPSIGNTTSLADGTTAPDAANAKAGFTKLPKASAALAEGKGIALADQGVAATYFCQYAFVTPSVVDFLCTVTTGTIQLYITCSDGAIYFSPPLPGPGTYYQRGSCGLAVVTGLGAIQLS